MEVKDFEELSAKVAQLQAALAEVDNVGAVDRAELEEAYKIPSFEENDSADEREEADDEAAAKPKPKPKKKAAAKPKAAASTAPRAKRKTVKEGEHEDAAHRHRRGAWIGAGGQRGRPAAESRRNRRIARKNADTRKQTDSMKTYLKDIGTVSLLTGAEKLSSRSASRTSCLNSVYERLEEENGEGAHALHVGHRV